MDAKHKLIVASEVVNDGNDTGQLHVMAEAARQALGVATLTAVADGGYYNGETLRACEASGITAYVPLAQRDQRLTAQGRFSLSAFRYDAAADLYRCPGDALLRPMSGQREAVNAKRYTLYVSHKSDCDACPLRARCLSDKAERRTIYRWEHEAVIERHRARMAEPVAAPLMSRRAALVEHPFGTLKCRAGYRHFLVRGLHKVRGEWGLMALCYNLARVTRIIGAERLIAWLARRAAHWWFLLLCRLAAVVAAAIDQPAEIWVIWRRRCPTRPPRHGLAA